MVRTGDHPSVIVVGAGVFGASVAAVLAERGWAVQILEMSAPGHERSSSHDASRLLRMSHGDEDLPDLWYTRSALNSRELWLEIGADEGCDLFVPCGALWLARSANGFESRSEKDLAALQIPAERLDPAEAQRFFPDVFYGDLDFLLYEPLAGVLRARACVSTLISRAKRYGAVLRTGRVVPDPAGSRLDGEILMADRVVWACGPWLSALFPGLVELRSVKQSVFYFGVEPQWSTPPLPAWLDDGADSYGLGDLDGSGFKAVHAPPDGGPEIDPDGVERFHEPGSLDRTRQILGHRFPPLATADLVTARVCQVRIDAGPTFHRGSDRQHSDGLGRGRRLGARVQARSSPRKLCCRFAGRPRATAARFRSQQEVP